MNVVSSKVKGGTCFIKKKLKQYFQNFHRKLRTLKTTDFKEYWSPLNKSTQHSSNTTKVNVPLSMFCDHFKKLGESMTS